MLSPARLTRNSGGTGVPAAGDSRRCGWSQWRIYFRSWSVSWLVSAVALLGLGPPGLASGPGQWRGRWQTVEPRLSLLLLGTIMLAQRVSPFCGSGKKLLALAGLVLILRGIFGSILIFPSS